MTLDISPSSLQGAIVVPPSKSHTMRAILLGSLGQGLTTIRNYLPARDTESMIAAMRTWGVDIVLTADRMEITGGVSPRGTVIDAGNSGQVLRFVGAFAALLPHYTVVTGDHSIRHQRPVSPLLGALRQLSAFAELLGHCAPIIVKGPMCPGHVTLSGEDSQPVSGLLMATAFLPGTTHLTVTHPGERPWIDVTLAWLRRLGAVVTHQEYCQYTIQGHLEYGGFDVTIPGDFSSAAFPLAAALVTHSKIVLHNIDMEDVQGDKQLITVLEQMGACIEISCGSLTIDGRESILGGVVDVNAIIDAVPILAVLGCFALGEMRLVNGAIARCKESDRLHVMAVELRKMGAQIEEQDDGLLIVPAPLHGASLEAHADHRVAMALAVAALGATTPSTLHGISCIAKSYPSFIVDFQRLGARW